MARTLTPTNYGGLRVLVAGGGVAALEAVFALRGLAGDLVDVEILAPEPRFFYRPQAVIEPFGGVGVQTFELAELAEAAEARLTLGELASVSPGSHVARTTHGQSIPYDVLLIASGAVPRPILRDAITFRGPADSDRMAALAHSAKQGEIERVTLAIPTRRTWLLPPYELAFGLRSVSGLRITIATVENSAGSVLGRSGSTHLASLLAARDIRVETGVDFEHGAGPGLVVAAPELWGDRIYGIPADGDGFIPTNRFGAVHGLADVYAAGDVTSYGVKHGSLAAAQADAVAEAIAARAGAGVLPTPFEPVLRARLACGEESIYVRRHLDDPLDAGLVSLDPLWSPAAKIFARRLAPALADISYRRQRTLLALG